jgi:two-component system sensor histidine kinase DegS
MADADDPQGQIIETITEEMQRIQVSLNEIKGSIDQTQMVVNREQQRNSDLATELRTVQDNIDTIPRSDIRTKYDEAMEARFKLSTMRGQLEKFQTSRELLEKQQSLLAQLLSKIQGVDILPGTEPGGSGNGSTNGGGFNITRIIQAQEEERQRLARQMHDGPAQSLTNFILQAEICQRLFDRNPDKAAEELDNLKSSASVTFQKVRDFIFDLRPMMLDDLGVVPTVRRYTESFQEKNEIETTLDLLGDDLRLENSREVLVFRAIQELMVQAREYAAPTKLHIQLEMTPERVRVVVEDDGRGFDAEAALAGNQEYQQPDPRAQSVLTLKEKFELAGGSVAVSSSETEGTTVRLELPVNQDF